jgi:hypothetical protein
MSDVEDEATYGLPFLSTFSYGSDSPRSGLPFRLAFVPLCGKEERVQFGRQLVRLHDSWKLHRRLFYATPCINPRTGQFDISFRALAEETDPGIFESRQAQWARQYEERFWNDDEQLNCALCDALAMISPSDYRELVEVYSEDVDEPACIAWAGLSERCQRDSSWQSHFFDRLNEASQIVHSWEDEWKRLQHGETLDLWRYYSSAEGARKGGIRSAETRAKNVLINAEAAIKLRDELLSQGRSERSVAQIIAQRHSVTPDHVRRLIRSTKKARHEGG